MDRQLNIKNRETGVIQSGEGTMNGSMLLEKQLLATKFFVPVASGPLISRPRLTALLNESLTCPCTLVSAPAGFGKTTLLSAWSQSLPANNPRLVWVSLDEEDNDPRLFWTYVLTALDAQHPEHFTFLLKQLQSPQSPPLQYILTMLLNLLTEGDQCFLLILDDYQLITEEQVHTTLAYLVKHLPDRLHLILSTRADPPLPLSQLRSHKHLLEVHTNQLRCTAEETRDFLKVVMGIQVPDETIQQITTRTEGWLVGLQLLGLSLPKHANPVTLLEQTSGDQRYINCGDPGTGLVYFCSKRCRGSGAICFPSSFPCPGLRDSCSCSQYHRRCHHVHGRNRAVARGTVPDPTSDAARQAARGARVA